MRKRLWELFYVFLKIGTFTFGGGYAMLSLLDHECVEKRGWIDAEEMMNITVVAESTPGPIAINCATYTGYKRGGVRGAIVATVGMILPSFLIIFILSSFIESVLGIATVAHAFRGIRIAVALLIVQTGIKMLQKILAKEDKNVASAIIVSVFFLFVMITNFMGIHVSTIYLILCGGFLGFAIYALPGMLGKAGGNA